jgi:hypothetical protein
MPMSPKEQHALEAVLHRSSVDREFRRQLLSDPRQAIQQAYGVTIPSSFRVKFIERDEDVDALVVLPDFSDPQGVLSDNELETVAGGAATTDSWTSGIGEG